ncbi:MAG: hypothetical protein ACRD3Q_18430, partial [Terriglobales bacterium]
MRAIVDTTEPVSFPFVVSMVLTELICAFVVAVADGELGVTAAGSGVAEMETLVAVLTLRASEVTEHVTTAPACTHVPNPEFVVYVYAELGSVKATVVLGAVSGPRLWIGVVIVSVQVIETGLL